MNILADRHHADLWWSLSLLADRLDAKLYCPSGIEWFDEGYLRLYGDLKKKEPYRWLAKQYLEDTIFDGYFRETKYGCIDYPKPNLLTLEEFKNTDIDIIICTVHENEPYFAKLKEFHPKAKFIRQVGNNLDTNVDHNLYPNLLSSAVAPYESFDGHKVLYRQEFDLNLFKYAPPNNFNNIYSFQNDLGEFEETWEMWARLQHNLKNFNFKSFGIGNMENIYPKRDYIKAMLDASFTYHFKPHDGYGHFLHNAMCLGRPLIVKQDYVSHGLITPMLEDEVTCLYIDDKIEEKIRKWSQPEKLTQMSKQARERFNEVVDFDKEFDSEVKPFFEKLI